MKISDPRNDLSTALVLSWAAVSTKAQDKYSIEDQLKAERDWIRKAGATSVDELIVRGFSRDYWTLADVVAAAAHDPEMSAFARLQAHIRKRSFTVFLCWDADRFGRTQSLVHEVIGRITRDCNALIYCLFDGVWMDAENAPTIGMIKAHKAQQDVTKLKDYRVVGMDNRARDGKSTTAIMPLYHKRVRDERGDETGVVVNEDLRPLWNDLAKLILRGVSWDAMEQVLWDEFGHGRNGKPYHYNYMRQIVMNYSFWGHAAINYKVKSKRSTVSTGPWIWDEHIAPPTPTTVYRNRLPAVYTGELAEQLKAELWRRYSLRGKTRALDTYRFNGFCVCDECGYTMNRIRTGKTTKRTYIRCETRFGSKHRQQGLCAASVNMREEKLQAYFHQQLEYRLEGLPSELFDSLDDGNQIKRDIEALERQQAQLQRKAEAAAEELLEAHENMRPILRKKGNALGSEMQRVSDMLNDLQNQLGTRTHIDEARARFFHDLEEHGVDWLWKQPDTYIHQGLAASLGDAQIVIRDGEVIGTAPTTSNYVKARRFRED